MNTKQMVQIAIVIVGLGVAGVSVALFNPFKAPVDLADYVTLVDVETGKLYRIKVKNRGIMPPMRSPDTDKLTLIPIRNEDGAWYVRPRYEANVQRMDIDKGVWEQIRGGTFTPESEDAPVIEPKY